MQNITKESSHRIRIDRECLLAIVTISQVKEPANHHCMCFFFLSLLGLQEGFYSNFIALNSDQTCTWTPPPIPRKHPTPKLYTGSIRVSNSKRSCLAFFIRGYAIWKSAAKEENLIQYKHDILSLGWQQRNMLLFGKDQGVHERQERSPSHAQAVNLTQWMLMRPLTISKTTSARTSL